MAPGAGRTLRWPAAPPLALAVRLPLAARVMQAQLCEHQATQPGAHGSAFTPLNGLLLAVLAGLAACVLPAPGRTRLWIAGLLVASTLLAWLLADPIRDVLGLAPSSPPRAPPGDAGTTGGA